MILFPSFQEEVVWLPEYSRRTLIKWILCDLPKLLTPMAMSKKPSLLDNNQLSQNLPCSTDFPSDSNMSQRRTISPSQTIVGRYESHLSRILNQSSVTTSISCIYYITLVLFRYPLTIKRFELFYGSSYSEPHANGAPVPTVVPIRVKPKFSQWAVEPCSFGPVPLWILILHHKETEVSWR